METKTIARVNKTDIIVLVENVSKKLVPISPICDALGIDSKAQRNRIERDEILSKVKVMTTSTGSDGKQYDMMCLPLKFVFGWLFSIDTSRVSEDAKSSVIKYKLACYDALYEYFSEYAEFVEARGTAIEKQVDRYQALQTEFKNARFNMDEAKKKLNEAKSLTFEKYKSEKDQFKLNFLDENQVLNPQMERED